jgi:D-alanine-D-alanine ligase
VKVAVVCNSPPDDPVIAPLGRRWSEAYSANTVQLVVESLRQAGHEVIRCAGDKTLLATLERSIPSSDAGTPGGIVFNMAYGIRGDCRCTHVPAMLEMAGVPYTGSNPLGHALAHDKVITKDLIRLAGVPTPNYGVMRTGDTNFGCLRFPLVVKPRHESTSFGLRLAHDPMEAAEAVSDIVERYQQDALVEEYVEGRGITVALLGNHELEYLPPVEQHFGERDFRMAIGDDQYHGSASETAEVFPAIVDGSLLRELHDASAATFRACHCRDYARVDIRVDAEGTPWVLGINAMALLGTGCSYVLAARAAGYSYGELVNRILDVAQQRYLSTPAPRHPVGTADCGGHERSRTDNLRQATGGPP